MPGTTQTSFVRRWRAPLLTAAAVAAVAAVAIVATQPGRSNQATDAAAPGGQSESDGSAGDTAAKGMTADGLVFAHHPDQNGGNGALLEGVVVDRDGCLAVSDDAGHATVPTFPLPSTDPATLRVGDRIALGGGFADINTVSADVVIPDACREAAGEDELFIAWSLEILPGQADSELTDNGAQFVPPSMPVAPSGDVPPEMAEPVAVEIDTGWAGTAAQQMRLRLVGKAGLEVDASDTDTEMALSESDGTPLGYIRVASSTAEQPDTLDTGGMYLFGAVGPSVERLAILATDAEEYKALLSDQIVEYPASGPLWTIAETGDLSTGEERGARIIWTDLPDGWHAFGVQSSAPSPALTVLAYDGDRKLLQARQYSPSGVSYDLPTDVAPDLDIWDLDRPESRFDSAGPNGAAGPYVATYPDSPDDASMAALLEGEVAVQDGCVIVIAEGGTYTPAFPQSQIEPATPPIVLHFNGTDYAPRDTISLGGGGMNTHPEGVPAACTAVGWTVAPG